MNLDKTYAIDFNSLSFLDGDFKRNDDFCDIVREGGCASFDDQWIAYEVPGCEDLSVVVEYSLEIDGYFDECTGDYWTPPACDFILNDAEVRINRFLIDDFETEISPEIAAFLKGMVEKTIGI